MEEESLHLISLRVAQLKAPLRSRERLEDTNGRKVEEGGAHIQTRASAIALSSQTGFVNGHEVCSREEARSVHLFGGST